MIEHVPPHARSAYDRLMTSCGELEAARTRALDTDLKARVETRIVTAELLDRLASSPRASADLTHYARRVASGECSWERIEVDADPVPPEVDELKADSQIMWPNEWPTSTTEVPSQPYRIPWE
ncbi:hypothetical protein CH275_28575 [Rhodococcus sp. 06-235-1A]|uniref:hypothetical protein n=1 Tax=Rhodococcus sp. 06-235-1A TaxID=2022508 RepID=UPI000B9A7408|nr:hypothetical protein [Rhodococcus sp. 06-235-1A]OZC94906.1 hypothetical protein CH275_28575 [Rhodococcus sp. 06-235-1A]